MIVHPPQALGQEQVPLVLVDAAHPAPAALVAAAAGQPFAADAGDFYPGQRARVPADYAPWLQGVLRAALGRPGLVVQRCTFATATCDPATLSPVQRIPHFDAADPDLVAVVHYLCAAPHAGTLFFRHRASGFERITAARQSAWRAALVADGARHGMPPLAYVDGDTPAFTLIGCAPLAFNRLAVYPANCLHAGAIGASWRAPAPGRLTITALAR